MRVKLVIAEQPKVEICFGRRRARRARGNTERQDPFPCLHFSSSTKMANRFQARCPSHKRPFAPTCKGKDEV
jgi:hypothetical protein